MPTAITPDVRVCQSRRLRPVKKKRSYKNNASILQKKVERKSHLPYL
jgi:hypothetical protein